MTALEKRLLSLQHQLHQLNIEISSLLTSANQLTASGTDSTKTIGQHLIEQESGLTKQAEVGINRYRQLQTSEPANYSDRLLSRSGQR